MELQEITNKELWQEKMLNQKQTQFLQSWEWGQFQQSVRRKVKYLQIGEDFILVIKMPLTKWQNYLYIPRTDVEFTEDKLNVLRKLTQAENSVFIRIEPVKQNLENLGFNKIRSQQPQKTLIIDLSKTEEELLKSMHQKTRYNIRLAAKKGVNIRICDNSEEFDLFYDIIKDTYSRKNKKSFSRDYYQSLFNNELTKIFFAQYQGKIIVANMIVFYGDTVTYVHGGSSDQFKNVMAPYLMQWESIRMAKAKGYQNYDFWGIEDHYPGVARFKKGFGGKEIEYSGAFDLPLNKWWYKVYKIYKKFK